MSLSFSVIVYMYAACLWKTFNPAVCIKDSTNPDYDHHSSQALDMIRKADLSAALFAPGWVYETQDKANFFQNQDQ